MLFAVPNAARRSARNGAYMKDEGMLPGVADLILLKSNRFYGALCVEMKKSREEYKDQVQKEWQRNVRRMVTKYVVVKSLDDFIDIVDNYLKTYKCRFDFTRTLFDILFSACRIMM